MMCHFSAKLFTKAVEAKKRFSSRSLSRGGEKPRAPGPVHIQGCPIFAAGVSRSPHQTVGLPSTAFWGLGGGVRRGGTRRGNKMAGLDLHRVCFSSVVYGWMVGASHSTLRESSRGDRVQSLSPFTQRLCLLPEAQGHG